MAAVLDPVEVIPVAFKNIHEIIHCNRRATAWNILLFAEDDCLRRQTNIRFLHCVRRCKNIPIGIQICEEVVPAVDKITAIGAIFRRGRTAVSEGWAAKSIRRTNEEICRLIIFFEQSGPAILIPPGRVKAIEVVSIHLEGCVYLFQIVNAFNAIGRFFRASERRQEHAGQNRYDRDDHQEFNQRESCCSPACLSSCVFISIQKKQAIQCSFHAFYFVFMFWFEYFSYFHVNHISV